MVLNRKIFYLLLVISSIFLAVPVFFVDNQVLTGIFCILGFIIFLFLNLEVKINIDRIILYLCFALSFAIRFCRVFTPSIEIFFLGFLATFAVGVIIDLFFFVTSLVHNSKLRILTPFIFPTFYVGLFIILALVHFGNTFNLFTYFTLITPLTYNLKWSTEYGFIFIILLAICFLIEIPFLYFRKKIFNGSVGITIIVALCVSGMCLSSSYNKKSPDFTIQVALALAEKRDFNGNSEVPMTKEDYQKEFKKRVEEASNQHADLIVFNEEYSLIDLEDIDNELSFYSETFKTYQIPALIGASIESENGLYKNCAYFFDSNGDIISIYQKVNLIPYIETLDYEKSSGNPSYFIATIGGHEINVSTIICFDINNDLFLRNLNPQTELLIVPSWDWDNGNEEQLKTYVRSIEYNTTVLKHSYDGFSYVSTLTGLYGDVIDNRNNYSSITMTEVPIYKK